jgi:hypothetical protein
MIENNPTNVFAAFELLLEELEAEVEFTNKVGAKSFESRNYDRAKEALERVGFLTAFRDKVAGLRKEWEAFAATEPEEDEEAHAQRRNLGRLQRGVRTREELYVQPILKALVERGGSARMNDVIGRVGQLMKGVLKDVDRDPLASDPDMPRWRNAAQWARWAMVKDGLLKPDSPRGIWEVTDEGRRTLK